MYVVDGGHGMISAWRVHVHVHVHVPVPVPVPVPVHVPVHVHVHAVHIMCMRCICALKRGSESSTPAWVGLAVRLEAITSLKMACRSSKS